ncbi:MAG: repeat-containing protein [Rariglobus sp.]|jgi:Flp pilus assembly protein TadD|nr:repeat-containing protein [Rariglobus sp.]
MISTHKHLDYALGYIGLNLLAEARDELALIKAADRETPEVLGVQVELAMARQTWTSVITLASRVTAAAPVLERPWIAWAYALREKQRITEARDVLLRAEGKITDPSPLVDYNLACYFCLLGDLPEARRRLKRACAREPDWKTEAASDPDLAALK